MKLTVSLSWKGSAKRSVNVGLTVTTHEGEWKAWEDMEVDGERPTWDAKEAAVQNLADRIVEQDGGPDLTVYQKRQVRAQIAHEFHLLLAAPEPVKATPKKPAKK